MAPAKSTQPFRRLLVIVLAFAEKAARSSYAEVNGPDFSRFMECAANDGVEVIINIRRLKRDQKIMVVVEEDNVKAMALRVGADVVVMKPISSDMVLHQVNDMLMQTKSFLDRKRSKYQRVH